MTKPFNLEEARAGKPIEYCPSGTTWKDGYFVGTNSDGHIVIEDTYCSRKTYGTYNSAYVRMKSQKRIVWMNLYKRGLAYPHTTEELADIAAKNDTYNGIRIGNKAWPLEIEDD